MAEAGRRATPEPSESERLLAAGEPHPVHVERAEGSSPYFFTCDHAGHRLPRRLGDLGLGREELRLHIGWDIGAFAVAQRLSRDLDATLVAQLYSRLVIDCNRRPGTEPSIAERSENTNVPGNRNLGAAARRAREREVFEPYHREISRLLDCRRESGRRTILVAMHSLTETYDGVERPWHITFSCDEDRSVVDPLLELLREDSSLVVGDNEPYQVNEVDYTLPVHGTARGLPRALIELRQDLVAEEAGQSWWAERLATVLRRALERIGQ